MVPANKGRFCHSCRQVVRDLRDHSYAGIAAEYEASGGKICGRVNVKELSKGYVDHRLRQLRAEQLKNFFLAVLLSFGVSLFSVTKASAIHAMKQLKAAVTQVSTDTIVIKGTVTDKENNEPLPFAVMTLCVGDSVLTSAMTDLDGKYKLSFPLGNHPSITLRVTYIGYNSMRIINIKPNDKQEIEIDVKLTPSENIEIVGIIIEDPSHDPDKLDGTGKKFKRDDIRRMPK